MDILSRPQSDVNAIGSRGQLPIIEAVKSRSFDIVDLLIQAGAYASGKEPATGITPLHLAFERSMEEIAELLIKYGADPATEDKRGKRPRDFTPTIRIHDLILKYDAGGHEAFEDAPGTWLKHKDGEGHTYFFNIHTKESRWTAPTSCAWHRVDVYGHPFDYVNSITGQEMHKMPKALAWSRVKAGDEFLWYNYMVNHSQSEAPAELPVDLLEEAERQVNHRWHNTITDELSWEDPRHHNPWRTIQDKDTGGQYYYNVLTGESVWEKPAELSWEEVHDEEGRKFYYNHHTKESQWEAPHHLAWEHHEADVEVVREL